MASPLSDATSGALGSVLANTIVFPLDVIKTRMQVQTKEITHAHYHSTTDAVLKIVKHEGIAGLYVGLGSGLVGTLVSSFSYFYIYSTIRGGYSKSIKFQPISTAMELFLGAAAGALCQFIVLPIGIVTTRQQTNLERLSVMDTVRKIIKEEGVKELWKGLQASLVLCVNPAITYGVFERLRTIFTARLKDPKAALTSGQVFLIGALSKALATIVTYPYIMAKIRMQWKPSKKSLEGLTEKQRKALQYTGAVDILKKVYKSDGIKGLYTGMQTQILKAVLSQAIVFTLKEKISFYTVIIFTLMKASSVKMKNS
ncbi:ADP/ATP carrier protein [Globomyces sp. JEL0801]|nr:ADP/ATP carrier protein [Globomyces sp. JEL0801]